MTTKRDADNNKGQTVPRGNGVDPANVSKPSEINKPKPQPSYGNITEGESGVSPRSIKWALNQ